jgi:SHS2 domain-containing protein
MISDHGFREIAHTADWELEAWAPSLAVLVEQAALGMADISGLVLGSKMNELELIEISGDDPETIIIGFLSELLYIQESRGLGSRNYHVRISGLTLTAQVVFQDLVSIQKEIKAVTWHKIKVTASEGTFRVCIVFDV